MVKTKVKICGITTLEDARAAAGAGCEALGFNFFRASPRYITPEKAREIIRRLPAGMVKIGVFVNSREATIRRIAGMCGLDIVQLHGNESPEFCSRLKGLKVIKAFRIKGREGLERISLYHTFAYLLDAYSPSAFGGTGKRFNWELAQHLAGLKTPVFLSGGLREENVKKAVCTVHPQWVDVCSSVESAPGRKDPGKMKAFVKAVRQVKRCDR